MSILDDIAEKDGDIITCEKNVSYYFNLLMKKNSCISVVWECKKCSIKRSSNHNYIQCEVKVSESNLKSFVLEVLDYYENNVIGCTYCKNDVTLTCSLHDNYLAIGFEHQNIKIDLHQVQVTFIKNAKTFFFCAELLKCFAMKTLEITIIKLIVETLVGIGAKGVVVINHFEVCRRKSFL